MKMEWIEQWEMQQGLRDSNGNLRPVKLPGYTSTSLNLETAINFSAPDPKETEEYFSVIFVLTIRNFDYDAKQGSGFKGYDM